MTEAASLPLAGGTTLIDLMKLDVMRACTVLIGGRRVLSCLTLALVAEGQEITTIEGLAQDGKLHPMQQAFIDQDAFQCRYCTPGQIMSAVAGPITLAGWWA